MAKKYIPDNAKVFVTNAEVIWDLKTRTFILAGFQPGDAFYEDRAVEWDPVKSKPYIEK